jgi:hypothetical protein
MAAQAAASTSSTADCTDPAVLQQLRELHPGPSEQPMRPYRRMHSRLPQQTNRPCTNC